MEIVNVISFLFVTAFARVTNTRADDNVELIRVHRSRMLAEVLQLYHHDAQLPLRPVKVEFIDELGDDVGGLTKDLFTSLWVQILQQYFAGESAVVPYLPLYKHMDCRQHFRAIGHILAHTVALLKIIPARLSRCFLLCLSLGPSQITDDLLLSDFRYPSFEKCSLGHWQEQKHFSFLIRQSDWLMGKDV